jgi:hypothetical protein
LRVNYGQAENYSGAEVGLWEMVVSRFLNDAG